MHLLREKNGCQEQNVQHEEVDFCVLVVMLLFVVLLLLMMCNRYIRTEDYQKIKFYVLIFVLSPKKSGN